MATNYEAMITKFSWWKSSERVVVVVERHGNFNEDKKFVPTQLILLEQLTDKTAPVNWDDMVKMIEDGRLINVSKPS